MSLGTGGGCTSTVIEGGTGRVTRTKTLTGQFTAAYAEQEGPPEVALQPVLKDSRAVGREWQAVQMRAPKPAKRGTEFRVREGSECGEVGVTSQPRDLRSGRHHCDVQAVGGVNLGGAIRKG